MCGSMCQSPEPAHSPFMGWILFKMARLSRHGEPGGRVENHSSVRPAPGFADLRDQRVKTDVHHRTARTLLVLTGCRRAGGIFA